MQPLHLLCASLALLAPVPSQDDYTARLDPKSRVVPSGHDVALVLTIDVKKDVAIPAVLLTGTKLEAKVGDKTVRIEDGGNGTVKLAGGTRIERTITVPAGALALPAAQDLIDVTFAWSGLPAATAVVKIAPDTTKLDVDALDLTKTKVLLITSMGQMTVRLLPDKAPQTARNFVKLAKDGFYDGTRFHRIIRDFMIQGGCPNTKAGATGEPGGGGPGHTIKAEFNDTRHVKGVLSMARSAHPDSAGSQFFIVHGTAPHLDNQYTAFGVLESGHDVLDKIATARVKPTNTGEASVPVEPIHLHSAIVLPAVKSK